VISKPLFNGTALEKSFFLADRRNPERLRMARFTDDNRRISVAQSLRRIGMREEIRNANWNPFLLKA
jgi:hypothetical protein